jgi:signal transduction histidine kinase
MNSIPNIYSFLWPKHKPISVTFREELHLQSRKFFVFTALLCSFVWIPYIEIDEQLVDNYHRVVALRYGFSVISITLLICAVLSTIARKNMGYLLEILFCYLLLTIPYITSMSMAHPNYLTGYFIALLCTCFQPFKFSFLISLITASISIYIISNIILEVPFDTVAKEYGKQDVFTTYLCCMIFGYSLYRMRWELESALKERTIELEASYTSLTQSLSDNRDREVDLKKTETLLAKVSGNFSAELEQDRKNMADQLHDTVSQSLTMSKLKLDQLVGDDHELKDELKAVAQHIRYALTETRQMVNEVSLKVLDDFGLMAGLQELNGNMELRYGLQVEYTCSIMNDQVLSLDGRRHFYRCAQELLNNVVKHSNISQAKLSLIEKNECIEIEVQDNGCGFHEKDIHQENGYGLLRMQQRSEELGGTMLIKSEPDMGCCIKISLPLLSEREGLK